jgi:hypothetical protein
LGQLGHLSVDDAHLQLIFDVQDRVCKWTRIPAANQNFPLEIHFSGWEDHPNCQKRDNEAF